MSELPEENVVKNRNGFFVIVIILLLVGMAYMAYVISQTKVDVAQWQDKYNKRTKENKEMSAMLEEYGFDITNDIKKDVTNILNAYAEMEQLNMGDKDTIAYYKERFLEMKERAERGDWSARELVRMRKEMASLREIAREYIVKVDSLNTLNLQLRENIRIKDADIEIKTTQISDLDAKLTDANQKIKIGEKLQAFSFESGGEKQKLNGSLESTNRAKNCVRVYSRFTLSENKLTSAGEKIVYMQVIAPNGKTLQTSTSNYVETDKGKIPYSDKNKVDYNNQRTDMAIYFRLGNIELEKGNYKVNIYCQGQLIGSDNFSLK